MLEVIKTVYRNGVFVPQTSLDFPEDAVVEIVIEKKAKSAKIDKSNITDEEKSKQLKELVERMQKNPIPSNAPRFTREELY